MSGSADAEDRVNMIPLIDTMFFLILFFMLVTKFTPDEKAITSLLPTDKGQSSGPSSSPVPKEQINIAIYPMGMQKGFQPSQYRDQLLQAIEKGSFNRSVLIRIGGSDPVEVQGEPLSEHGIGSPLMKEQVRQLHAYVERELSTRENAGPRKDLPPVIISCFSGLSWKYALLAYDAVRAHELKAGGKGTVNSTNADLLDAREVTFAPPRIRNYSANELGNELYEVIHLR